LLSPPLNFQSVISEIEDAGTAEKLWDILFGFAQQFSASNISYYHMPPAGSFDFCVPYVAFRGSGTNDLGEYEGQLRKHAKHFIPTLRTLDSPIFFAKFCQMIKLDSELSDLVVNFHFSDTGNGMVIPVHGPNGRSGALVIGFKDTDRRHSREETRELQWVSEAAHRAFCRLRSQTSRVVKSLSSREKEVMKWVAAGKSNPVIAEIMDLSHHTVNGYLRSIYLKTGTSDRTTAVLRCIGETLLEF